ACFPWTRACMSRRRAAVQTSDDAWNLPNRLAKVYISPDAEVLGAEGSWLNRALLRRAHRRRWSLGIELALNSGHLTAKPSALTRRAQPALGALNDSCVATSVCGLLPRRGRTRGGRRVHACSEKPKAMAQARV